MKEAKAHHKMLAAIVMFSYFLIGYLTVMYLPRYASFYAETFIDEITPFIPFFIIFYSFVYLFAVMPVLLVKEKKELYWLAINYFLLMTASFLIFLLLPIAQKPHIFASTDIFSRLVQLFGMTDTGFNNFPSLHVSASTFAYLFINDKSKKLGRYLLPILILSILSTLFIKHHLVIDVIGGLGMAFLFRYFYKKYKTAAEKRLSL
jgi:membrane-associated phospholipid phosphatase